MHARSALFDVYGDHLRTRGSQAPVAAVVRLLAPGRDRGARRANRDLPDGDAGLAGAGAARRRPRLPGHRRAPTARLDRGGRADLPARPVPRWDGAWHLLLLDAARASAPPATGCAPTSPSWGSPSSPTTSGSARSSAPELPSVLERAGATVPDRPRRRTSTRRPTEAWDLAALRDGVRRAGPDRRRPGRRAAPRRSDDDRTRRRSRPASTSCTSGASSSSPTPACPPSCCPADWPGRAAAELFAERGEPAQAGGGPLRRALPGRRLSRRIRQTASRSVTPTASPRLRPHRAPSASTSPTASPPSR